MTEFSVLTAWRFKIMAAPSSSFIPTPLAHADNQGEGHPRGASLHSNSFRTAMITFVQWFVTCLRNGRSRDLSSGNASLHW
ncbi:hypothetical protein TNCV_830382 [Trichonephila clavipes]|nr:hypothetical protein TNCV_830382 [Trichonephila clavipes]